MAERIRDILLHLDETVPPLTELFLYLAGRSANFKLVIQPALRDGNIVVCERFSDATRAYQIGGRLLPEKQVENAIALSTGGVEPLLSILLDLDPEEGFRRIYKTGKGRDRIESEEIDFHLRVREYYLRLAEENPDRFLKVNASLDSDIQDSMILNEVKKLIKQGV